MTDTATRLKAAIRDITIVGAWPTNADAIRKRLFAARQELAQAATAHFGYDMTADVSEDEHLSDLASTCRNCSACQQELPCASCQQGSVCDAICTCDDIPDSMPW